MSNINEFEAALIKRLGKVELDKAYLKNTSSTIVKLKKQGLVIDKVLIKGQYRPDRVIINGTVDPEFWSKFGQLGGEFSRFDVFPYGIVIPDGFRFRGTLAV